MFKLLYLRDRANSSHIEHLVKFKSIPLAFILKPGNTFLNVSTPNQLFQISTYKITPNGKEMTKMRHWEEFVKKTYLLWWSK